MRFVDLQAETDLLLTCLGILKVENNGVKE